MKRPQKRFESREAIIAQIDALKQRQADGCVAAERMDAEANALRDWLAKQDIDNLRGQAVDEWHVKNDAMNEKRREAAVIRKYQQTLDSNLLRLKKTLAAFDTTPMLSLAPDASVVLQ